MPKSSRRLPRPGRPGRYLLRLGGWALLGLMLVSLLVVLPWRWVAPPTSSFMLQHRPAGPDYRWRPLAQIAPALQLAVIAAEDQRFPRHHGIDGTEIGRALADYRAGKPLRGASTITQQVAKNLYLWPSRSLWRKTLEVWLAAWIELCWPKQRILEVYLNVAQFGPGSYGAEAASQRFFQTPAVSLSRAEAALLAAVLPAPARYRVAAPSPRVRQRQQWILQQMSKLGGLSYLQRLR